MAKTVKGKIETQDAEQGDGKRDYVVCETAPMRVAGRRVQPGDRLRLTQAEALSELLALHISPVADASESTPSNPV